MRVLTTGQYSPGMDSYQRGPWRFDVTDLGPADGPVVVLLHGFPEDRGCWAEVASSLAGAGRRVLAPDQRGYSPGARPLRRRDYRIDELEADILALADAAGAERFDVVGHDWGAALAWALAARHPLRVRSVAALSVPHTQAFLRAMARGGQLLHSWYMGFFQIPALPERLMALAGPTRAAQTLVRGGLPRDVAARYAARLTDPASVRGPIGWYRAIPYGVRSPLPSVGVPALFVYGEGDPFITRSAADGCAACVTGPYRYEVLPGAGHWLPEANAARVAALLAEHLDAHGGPLP